MANVKVYLNEVIVCDSTINESIVEGSSFEFLYPNLELSAEKLYSWNSKTIGRFV